MRFITMLNTEWQFFAIKLPSYSILFIRRFTFVETYYVPTKELKQNLAYYRQFFVPVNSLFQEPVILNFLNNLDFLILQIHICEKLYQKVPIQYREADRLRQNGYVCRQSQSSELDLSFTEFDPLVNGTPNVSSNNKVLLLSNNRVMNMKESLFSYFLLISVLFHFLR